MKNRNTISLTLLFSMSVLTYGSSEAAAALNSAKIEQLTNLKGSWNDQKDVFKVSYPRTDLNVTAAGVKMNPAMGLTAWAAFTDTGQHTAVMGDMVMLEDQVNDVMSVALNNGLEVTALHNHFFGDSPKVMFMHIGGMGDEEKLATAVGKVIGKMKETSGNKGSFPRATMDPQKSTLETAAIDQIFGGKGELKDGVYKFTWGKTTKMSGHDMGKAMGVNTWAAFAGSNEQAVVDGDFAMYESELQDVLKALRKTNINVVAIHNHMTMEEPRIVFLHFWGVGPAAQLAKGVKSALDTQKN